MGESQNQNPEGSLPFFKTIDEALAFSRLTGDSYYLTAYLLEVWAGELVIETVNKYAERKINERNVQTGEAFRHEIFYNLFNVCEDKMELAQFWSHFYRFAQEENTIAEGFRYALLLFAIENEIDPVPRPQVDSSIADLRQYTSRFCDWYECHLHGMVHTLYYNAPGAVTSPDEESRYLFALGLSQSDMPNFHDYEREFFLWTLETASKELTSPDKWKFVGQGFVNAEQRIQTHPKIDEAVIAFWPLVRRYNWSYGELLNVLEAIIPEYRGRYPCDSYQSIQKHCSLTIGLKKGKNDRRGAAGTQNRRQRGKGSSLPKGYQIAKAMLAKNWPIGK